MTKSIEVQVDPTTWPPGIGPPLSLLVLSGVMNVDVVAVLREVALRTRPPTSRGFDLSDMWSWLRYFPALDNGPALRLRADWADVDPHQKVIFSDDWGMGLSMHVVGRALGFVAAVSTTYLVSRVPGMAFQKRPKRGPAKSPDFVALDSSGQLHVIECKGTQNRRSDLIKQMAGGIDQKQNIVFPAANPIGERLVAGVFVPQFDTADSALLMVIDPPVDDDAVEIPFSRHECQQLIYRGELASTLQLLGAPTLGNLVARTEGEKFYDRRKFATDSRSVDEDIDHLRRRSATSFVTTPFSYYEGERLVSRSMSVKLSLAPEVLDALLAERSSVSDTFSTRTRRASRSDGLTDVETVCGLDFEMQERE